jgi:hypothetical protein
LRRRAYNYIILLMIALTIKPLGCSSFWFPF